MKTSQQLLVAAALAVAASAHAASAAGAASPAPLAAALFTENFDNVSAFSGWLLLNQSDPVGRDWYQGNSGVFTAQSGAADSYIAADFLSAGGIGGRVDNWLLTPELTLSGTTEFAFYSRSAGNPGFSDMLQLSFGSGRSTSGYNDVLLTIGASSAYPNAWQRYSVTITGNSTGRFAFHYMGSGDSADYVGIDSLSVNVSAVPEPASGVMLGAGLLMLGLLKLRRRRGWRQLGKAALALGALAAVGLPASALARAAPDKPGMVVVRDAATGELRAPTPAEFRALQAPRPKASAAVSSRSSATSAAAPGVTRRADGTRQARVADSAMVFSVVTHDAAGQAHTDCVNGAVAAEAQLQATAIAAPTGEFHHEDR